MRALYTHEDLEVRYLSASTRTNDFLQLIQGKYQLVQGDHYDIIHVDNILGLLTDVAKVSLEVANLPLLTNNARWMREDVSIARGPRQDGGVLFHVDTVRTAPDWSLTRKADMNLGLQQGGECCRRRVCVFRTFYHPEAQKMRYCTDCKVWYHIACCQSLDTVANLRGGAATSGSEPAWWVVWKAPANTPRDIANDLENLVSMPLQRGYVQAGADAHPILSIEAFTVALRKLVKPQTFQVPATRALTQAMLHELLKSTLLDQRDSTIRDAAAAVRLIARVPLTERVIYKCPRRSHHTI